LSLLSFIITGVFLYFGAKWVKLNKVREQESNIDKRSTSK